jgi:hypothetical protein
VGGGGGNSVASREIASREFTPTPQYNKIEGEEEGGRDGKPLEWINPRFGKVIEGIFLRSTIKGESGSQSVSPLRFDGAWCFDLPPSTFLPSSFPRVLSVCA